MELLWFIIVSLMLAMYVILDGFDIGAGIVHLIAARNERERSMLLRAIAPYWDGNDPELIFWVRLEAGEEFRLAIENHNGTVRLPASFLMKGVTAVRVVDPAEAIR